MARYLNPQVYDALKEHEEFRGFLVLMEPVWPDSVKIHHMIMRLSDTKRRVYSDPNSETTVNAAMIGLCFN